MMLQSLFFPEKIGSYYLFKRKIVGIQITHEKIYATLLLVQANTLMIMQSLTIAISHEKGSLQERTTVALEKLMAQVGAYDSLIIALTSSTIMFKEQYFPFLSKEKIALVLPFELEPFLPFPLAEAFFDFCITKNYPEKNGSDVIIAAIQKKHLHDQLYSVTKLGIVPVSVTVDVLNLYGLYRSTPYFSLENQILVVCDGSSINVLFLKEGNLKAVRSLQRIEQKEEKFWQEFFFTLQSFFQEYGNIQKIVFITDEIAFIERAQKDLTIPCQQFVLSTCLEQLGLHIDPSVNLEQLSIFGLAAVYPSIFTTKFSLATEVTRIQEHKIFKKQVIAAFFITILILVGMISHTIIQVIKLSNAVDSTKQSIIKELKRAFPTIKSTNLNEAIKGAKKSVTKEEEIWFSFSNQTRRSFLKYLYELSTHIEREDVGLQLKKLVFTKSTIVLEGSVRNFEALAQFEQDLKNMDLFVSVPDFQKTDFSETLVLKTQREQT